MAHQGQAADYYYNDERPLQQPQAGYQGASYGQPNQYPQQSPPQYGQNYPPPQGPPPMQQDGYQQQPYGDNKQSFDEQFKIAQPKYNDWWAGLLFIAVFLGYTAVSVLAIRGYCKLATTLFLL